MKTLGWDERMLAQGDGDGGSYAGRDFYSDFYRNLSWIPKVPAIVSMLASVFIIQDILKSFGKRQKMSNQIMLGLSIADIGYALAHFIGTWAVVKGQVWGSRGTIATCEAQGYMHITFFHTGGFYNAALAIIYVLMVRVGWKDETFRKYKIHHLLLILPPILGTAVAIPSIPRDNFNFTGQWLCSGGPWPVGCDGDKIPCLRGESMTDMFASTECFVMCFWLAVICATIIFVSMLLLYCTVLANERAMEKYEFRAPGSSAHSGSSTGNSGSSSRASRVKLSIRTTLAKRSRSNDVAYQGILYVWAYIVVALCFLMMDVTKVRFSHQIDYALAFISPLQGFFNVLVYLRPRYNQYKRDHPNMSLTGALCDRIRLFCSNIKNCLTKKWPQVAIKKRNSNVSPENIEFREHSNGDNDSKEEPSEAAADREWDDYEECEPAMLFLLDVDASIDAQGQESSDRSDMESVSSFANHSDCFAQTDATNVFATGNSEEGDSTGKPDQVSMNPTTVRT